MTPFEFVEPASLGEAIALLDPDDVSTRPVGGGTAIMLMMKFGVLVPARLVSLRRVEQRFSRIAVEKDGSLRIGALATLRSIERSSEARRVAPVLADALLRLSNVRVRNVATLGGHLAHADPHMDLPPVLASLGAELVVAGPAGERTLPVADLFVGYLETVLKGNELIAEVVVPPQQDRRAAYVKCTTRSADDWPALGIAVSLAVSGPTIRDARIVLGAATDRPVRLAAAEAALAGREPSDALLRAAGDAAAAIELVSDAQGSAAYKRQLLRVYLGRAVRRALAAGPGAREARQ